MEGESAAARPPGTRTVVYALIAVIIAIVVIIAALFAAGIFRIGPAGLLPEAVYFTGYTGDGEVLIPQWWENRAQWPVEWFWSEGVKAQSFIDTLADAGIDVTLFTGTNPVASLAADVQTSLDAFEAAFVAEYGTDPEVFDPHTYDGIFVIALAMVKANQAGDTITGGSLSVHIRDVAGPPGTKIIPGEWAKALTALQADQDINYEGASGSVNFDEFGETPSDYEIYGVNETGKLFEFDRLTIAEIEEFRGAPPSLAPKFEAPFYAPPTADEASIGTILPVTGALAAFGGSMQKAADLAAKHINDNGGVNGVDLTLFHRDSQTVPTAGGDAASDLVHTVGVPAVVGAAASSVSQAVFAITGPARVLQLSPASTSPIFTTQDTTDIFFRTAPSDVFQGAAAAKYALTKWTVMSTIWIDNSYGEGLTRVFEQHFVANGGTILRSVAYEPDAPSHLSVLELVFTPVQPAASPPLAAAVSPRMRAVAS